MDRADLGQQLTELLGRRGPHNIRKTDENPPRASVIDVVVVLTGQTANVAAIIIGRLKEQHPEVAALSCDFKFPGRGQKKTPVAGVKGIVVSGHEKHASSYLPKSKIAGSTETAISSLSPATTPGGYNFQL